MIKPISYKKQKSRAQTMIEFALALPILLTLLYGVLETGRLLFIYSSTITAARQAVRYGSATGIGTNGPYYDDCDGIQNEARKVGFINTFDTIDISYDRGLDPITNDPIVITPVNTCPIGPDVLQNGDRIIVTVTTQWTPIVPLVPFEPFTITSESERTILVSADLLNEPDPSIYLGTGQVCAKLTSIGPATFSSTGPLTYTYTSKIYGDIGLDLVGATIYESNNKITGESCPASVTMVDNDTYFYCTGTYSVEQDDIDRGYIEDTAYVAPLCGGTKTKITHRSLADQTPGLVLTKTPDPEATSIPGTVITYTYNLYNSGKVSLIGPFSVSDNKIPSADLSCPQPASLLPGDSINCTGTHTLINQDILDREIVNVATAHAAYNRYNPGTKDYTITTVDSPSAFATVYTPPIYLVVVPSSLEAIAANQVITFTYKIKNITDVPIYSPSVTDSLWSVDCSAASNPIPVGQTTNCTASYTVTQANMDSGIAIVSNATAYGTRESQAISSNTYTISTPIKQAAALSATLTTVPSVTPPNTGATITYTYAITNSGNVTLTTPIAVVETLTPISCTDQTNFSPGTTRTCSGIYTVQQEDMGKGSVVNSGYATAKFGATIVTSNTLSATLATFTGPRFTIGVSPDKTIVTYSGEPITYTYTFTNTGGDNIESPYTVTSSLGSIAPSSPLDCSLATSPLPPGSSTTCKSTYTVSSTTPTTIINTVTDATAQKGGTVNATNSPVSSVTTTAYLCSSANLNYTAQPTSGGNGNDLVTWTISNTVGVPLPISAVLIAWANSGNGASDYHLDAVTVTNSTLNLNPLPDKISTYTSGTGTLNTGSTNITMDFSKNNPTSISVIVVFANPYGTCTLP